MNNIDDKDHPPILLRERRSWYLSNVGNKAFSSVAAVFIIPLLLDFVAFRAGNPPPIFLYHLGSSYDAPILLPGDAKSKLPDFVALTAKNASWFVSGSCVETDTKFYSIDDQEYFPRCVLPWAGGYIRTTSWTLNIISISVALQAFAFISLGALADHGGLRKKLFVGCSVFGAIFSGILGIEPGANLYWLNAVFVVFANMFFGLSIVFQLSYIPILSEYHPEVLEAKKIYFEKGEKEDDELNYELKHEFQSTVVSSNGLTIGFMGGVFMAAVGAGLFLFFGTNGLRYSMLAIAVWWFVFLIPSMLWLNKRPGPALPKSTNFFVYSWKNLFQTLKEIPKIPRTFLLLLCWMFYGDGMSTLTTVAVLFAQNELKADQVTIGLSVILAPLSAALGTFTFFAIQKRINLRAKTMLLSALVGYLLLSIYGLLGLSSLPVGLRVTNVIQLNDKCVQVKTNTPGVTYLGGEGCKLLPWELYMFVVLQAFCLGPLQAYTRVVFAELIPLGREAEFFALFVVTDEGSSWIGPLIVSALNQGGGSLRYSFVYFFFMFLLPIPLLLKLDLHKGKLQALAFSTKKRIE